ncbi:MAG: hypothetical protein J2P17_23285, partial [Mycobacterium sp.]|nr:hypothetical protein [Mycobacterium sp.]
MTALVIAADAVFAKFTKLSGAPTWLIVLIAVAAFALSLALSAQRNWAARRAAERGDADAMFHRGLKMLVAGRDAEAQQWFRRAGEAGHTASVLLLGSYLVEAGRQGEAEQWYRRA